MKDPTQTLASASNRSTEKEHDLERISAVRRDLEATYPAGRNLSMALTKLDEAYLWLLSAEEYQKKKVDKP